MTFVKVSVVTLVFLGLVSPATAPPAEAARSKCFGRRPTIVANGRGHHNVRGTRGRDVILVKRGSATIKARGGDDLICGGSRGDRIKGGSGEDRVKAGRGRDVVRGGKGFDRIRGGGGDDSLFGDRDVDHVRGWRGDDFIVLGQVGVDNKQVAWGGPGNDEIYGSEESEEVYGGSGDDLIVGREGTTVEYGWEDLLHGQAGNDHIITGTGEGDAEPASNSFGGPGNDILEDLDGGGTLAGGPGDDELIGPDEACCASLDYSGSESGVTVDLGAGVATGEGTDSISGRLPRVYGSPQDDILIGDDEANSLSGREGDDELHGAGGDDLIRGDLGHDALDGGPGDDTAHFGFAGEPRNVDLEKGSATGEGDDSIEAVENVYSGVVGRNDVVIGDDGPNVINWQGSVVSESRIEGRGGDDFIDVFGDGSVDGGDGDDVIQSGGMRNGEVLGARGDDLLAFHYLLIGGRDEPVHVDGGPDGDTISFRQMPAVDVDLEAGTAGFVDYDSAPTYGLVSIETVFGSGWDDILRGDAGANSLHGHGGKDRIEGRAGDDFLDGGTGGQFGTKENDVLDGGDGNDTCVNGERVSDCEM